MANITDSPTIGAFVTKDTSELVTKYFSSNELGKIFQAARVRSDNDTLVVRLALIFLRKYLKNPSQIENEKKNFLSKEDFEDYWRHEN